MWITEIGLRNIKSFHADHSLELSRNVNILIGPNNSGKSTILTTVLLLQSKTLDINDTTLGKEDAGVSIHFDNPIKEIEKYVFIQQGFWQNHRRMLSFTPNQGVSFYKTNDTEETAGYQFRRIPAIENQNLIYPFLSKRKVLTYSEEIRLQSSQEVNGTFSNLYAKVDNLSNADLPAYNEYRKACEEIIGFNISTTQSNNGKKAALIVGNRSHIFLESMGEGVANLLGIIVNLCMAENQIFLIEELENDIHPQALKALLRLIEKKSANNQFIISTHSNIVVKQLGGIDTTKVFKVSMELKERMPYSTVREVGNNPLERQEVLEELGYEFDDFSLWKAWLFLEEASAEGMIRDLLIPMFVPKLSGKLRTYSAKSVSEIEPKFEDFNKLFVFLHLQPTYKNRVWVIIDEGESEKKIIDKMRSDYSKTGWDIDKFLQFSQHDFERYYPAFFEGDIEDALNETVKTKKKDKKRALNVKVREWSIANPEQAKEEFKVSAKEVIAILKKIEKEVVS